MKFIYALLIFISLPTLAYNKAYKKALKHYENKDYFTALDTIASLYKYQTPDKNIQHFIEKLVKKTGTYYFNTYTDIELRKLNVPTTDLLMAKRNLYLGMYHYGHKRLKRIPKGHRLYPESLLIKASIYFKSGKYNKAITSYEKCSEEAEKYLNKTDARVFEYYFVLKDTCLSNIGRIHFQNKNYKQAIKYYDLVSKRSFKWPYLIIEKAWSYFYLGKHNRSLGMLMTYNSPLLKSYFMPEAEYLKALNYFKLCHYDKALIVINNFFKEYHPKSETLQKIIRQKNKKKLAYFDLMFTSLEKVDESHKFLRNIITQVGKRVKYQLDLKSYFALNEEIFRANKSANLKLLLKLQLNLKEQINHYVKVSLHQFTNEIHSMAEAMLNLKLETLSNQRTLTYKGIKLAAKKKSKKIVVDKEHNYWKFHKEFWADELGEYSFTLQPMCKESV